MTDTLTPYVPPGRRLVQVLDDGATHPCAWPNGCDSRVVRVLLEWTDNPPDPDVELVYGPQDTRHDKWVHADGTRGHGDMDEAYAQERCPACKAYRSLDHRDTGYGEARTCRQCGYSDYHDRGD